MRGKTAIARRIAIALAALGALLLVPASASAQSITAETNKGGSCQLEPVAFQEGDAITYGGRVFNCETRFGVRHASARSLLYEEDSKHQVDVTERESGPVPFDQLKAFDGEAEPPYRARFDVSIVLQGRRSMTKPRRPERWRDPHRRCRVGSTRHAGDTLFCGLQVKFGG